MPCSRRGARDGRTEGPNYEPNSWSGAERGPRESASHGFRSHATEERGPRLRIRPDSFADPNSQARQFYESQLPVEQQHIEEALVFELSKVRTPAIRARVVSQLLNIHRAMAVRVAEGLRLPTLPEPAHAPRARIDGCCSTRSRFSCRTRGPTR